MLWCQFRFEINAHYQFSFLQSLMSIHKGTSLSSHVRLETGCLLSLAHTQSVSYFLHLNCLLTLFQNQNSRKSRFEVSHYRCHMLLVTGTMWSGANDGRGICRSVTIPGPGGRQLPGKGVLAHISLACFPGLSPG